MKPLMSSVASLAVIVLLTGLAACAAPAKLDHMQADLTALRADVAALSERFDKLNKQLAPPEPPRVSTGFSGRPALGAADAQVGIVEFSDFQCPYCQRFHTTVHPMLKEHYIDSGKVRMIFRDLPLEFHPQARSAAVAVNCSGAQGHYWDMADAVFNDQERLGEEFYHELAEKFGLDMTAYQSCREDPANMTAIDQSIREAAALGIEGTPTFLVGRIEDDRLVDAITLVGAQPFPVLGQVIDSFLGENPESDTK